MKCGFVFVCAMAVLPAPSQAQDKPLNVTTSPVYRVGGEGAPEWAEFSDLRVATFAPTGELWLIDTRGGQIVRVAADGTSGQNLLRRGRGPGEFEVPFGIAMRADGKVAVGDLMAGNLQLLDARGTLVTGMLRQGLLRSADFKWLVGDDYIAVPSLFSTGDGQLRLSAADGSTVAQELPIVRFTLQASATPNIIARARLTQPPRSNVPFKTHAFNPRVHWDVHQGRIAVVDDVAYRITVLDAQGKSIGTITRAIEPRRPSRADMRAARAEARTRLIRADGHRMSPVCRRPGRPAGPIRQQC